ncbi:MAG: hypothetical protein CMA63_07735 [Euryarchaeota archaeon]|nr:hypothetical protein [Euryarchaeota archaeon]|tara:strand:- start:9988 stop:11274 length:1287 start_codon:yes stop_codon:yes gene_type:complete
MAGTKKAGDNAVRVLIVRGSFASLGGAERELLQLIRATSERWNLGVASLDFTEDASALLEGVRPKMHLPSQPFIWPTGALSEVTASSSRRAQKAWEHVDIPWEDYDAVHLSVGKGTLEILPQIPPHLPVHYHCLEPPRWLYEDVLHRRVDGTPKRPLWLTRTLFTVQRRRDRAYVKRLLQRPKASLSGNSLWIQQRIEAIYGLPSDDGKTNGQPPKRDSNGRPLEATHVMHVVEWKHWPKRASKEEKSALQSIPKLPGQYIVTVGQVSFVKGTWETVKSLEKTGLALVQVGGGSDEDKAAIVAEGKRLDVEVLCMPRLSQTALCALIRGARAMVSHARLEPFGLTPIEAMAIGIPALMVDEGGFQCTMSPVDSGRLIARNDMGEWKAAYLDAKDPELRKKWADNGRPYVEKNFTLDVQIKALERMFTE